MRFERLVSPSLTELFVKEIVKNILSGQVATGERLPNERDLARMMRVSRAVINSGITQLARMGFVEVVPRQGTFVADHMQQGTVESLRAIFEYNGGRFDPAMLEAIYEMRENHETHLARLAAERGTDRQVAELRAHLETLYGLDDAESLAAGTFKFYHLLAGASGNALYPMIVYGRKSIYVPLLRDVFRYGSKKERLDMMGRFIDLVAMRRADAAAESIRDICHWGRRVLEIQAGQMPARARDMAEQERLNAVSV